MSTWNNPQPLGAVLEQLIDRLGYRRKIDEVRAVETWAFVAGPQINAVTERAWIASGKLYVKISSAPWRHQLHLQRSQWRDRLNQQLGAQIVDEIVFR
jgi:predicted nucleic acid-binding Zn ribbon protein